MNMSFEFHPYIGYPLSKEDVSFIESGKVGLDFSLDSHHNEMQVKF